MGGQKAWKLRILIGHRSAQIHADLKLNYHESTKEGKHEKRYKVVFVVKSKIKEIEICINLSSIKCSQLVPQTHRLAVCGSNYELRVTRYELFYEPNYYPNYIFKRNYLQHFPFGPE